MKLYCILTICIALAIISEDPVEARDFTVYPVCHPFAHGKKCPGCKPFERCCGVSRNVCTKKCKDVCISSTGSQRAILTKCPLKRVCSTVPAASCKGANGGCICSALAASRCKPICRVVNKEVCTQPPCIFKDQCKHPCADYAKCKLDCGKVKVCPPRKCKIVPTKICNPVECKRCVICKNVPDCSVRCGSGYCNGANGDKCGQNCGNVCSRQVVPQCFPKLRPIPRATDDEDDDDDDDDHFDKDDHSG